MTLGQRGLRARPCHSRSRLGRRDLQELGLRTVSWRGGLWGHSLGSGSTSALPCAVLWTSLFTSLNPHSLVVGGSYPGGEGKLGWEHLAPTGLPGRAACGHPVSSLELCGLAWQGATLFCF